MTKFLARPVAYLTNDDFNTQGTITNSQIPNNIPVVVMLQANFCGYCTDAKPAFQAFAEKHIGKVFAGTIQGDGTEPGEKELSKRLKTLKKDFRGYPDYILFVGGKPVNKSMKGRSLKDLEDFSGV